MRIVSSFHDYYDGAAKSFGNDVTFYRTREVWDQYNYGPNFLTMENVPMHPRETGDRYTHYDYFILGFCGSRWPVITKHRYDYTGVTLEKTQYYSSDEKHIQGILESMKGIHISSPLINEDDPIWAVSVWGWDTRVIVNPVLQNYGFYKVFDAWTCAQELDMFLGNIATRPDKEPEKIDDKTKILSHGFDLKKSFRKDKK